MLAMLRRAALLLIFSCLDLPHFTRGVEVSHCPSSNTMKFTIRSSRNRTGHWTSKVSVDNSDSFGVSNAEGVLRQQHWSVELDHNKGGCDGTDTFTAVVEVAPPRAAPGYELFEGVGYYKFHTDPKRWLEALKVCEQEGAHLAIINSEKEAGVLKELFARYPKIHNADHGDVAGIGIHDRYVEGQYLTIYDDPIASTGFTRWSTINSQPDNWPGSDANPGEDCGSIHRDGELNDIGCNVRMAFICEQEL